MPSTALSDFLTQKKFLEDSADYLGLDLYHGDTESSHPYVCTPQTVDNSPTKEQIEVQKAFLKSAPPVLPARSYGDLVTTQYWPAVRKHAEQKAAAAAPQPKAL